MHIRHGFPIALTFALAAAAAPAQSFRLRKVERPELGLELRMIKALSDIALNPNERQIKVAWRGTENVKVDRKKTDVELQLTWFEIDRTKPRVDGGSELEVLNGANTLPDFLFRRGFDDPDDSRLRQVTYDRKNRAPKYGRRGEWSAVEVVKAGAVKVRAWYVETEKEIFGLIASSDVDVTPFIEFVERKMLRTIERSEPVVDATASADPYEGSDLPYLDARRKVVEAMPRSWQRRDTPNFLLITAIPEGGRNSKLVDAIAEDLEIMRKFYEERFPPKKPLDALAVVRIFDTYDAYMAYGAPKGTGGYWDPRRKELVLPNPGERIKNPLSYRKGQNAMDTLYHEAMHQYLSYVTEGIPPISWFNEGYGDYFGGAVLDRRRGEVEYVSLNKERWQMVGLQVKNDAVPPLGQLLTMEQDKFYGRFAGMNYAFAWAFCYFLEAERAKGEAGNQTYASIPERYLENLSKYTRAGGSPSDVYRRTHEATFDGIDIEELQRYWLEEMKTWKDPK